MSEVRIRTYQQCSGNSPSVHIELEIQILHPGIILYGVMWSMEYSRLAKHKKETFVLTLMEFFNYYVFHTKNRIIFLTIEKITSYFLWH